MEDLIDYATKIGTPSSVLVVLYALWRIVLWTRDNVVKPIVEAHIATLKTISTTQLKQTELLGEIKDQLGAVACLNGRPATDRANYPAGTTTAARAAIPSPAPETR